MTVLVKFGRQMMLVVFLIIYAFSVGSTSGQSNCVDPNNQTGVCVSLSGCPEIQEMISRTLYEPDLEFLRNVECENGVGQRPFVCCRSTIQNRTALMNFDGLEADNLLPTGRQCGPLGTDSKIIGGKETGLGVFPWMALLEFDSVSGTVLNCGGSLISNRYVLTAAHCVDSVTLRRVGSLTGVRLGEHNLATNPDCMDGLCADPIVVVPVEEIIVHEGFIFTSRDKRHDIALLRLGRNVNFTFYIRPICLPSILQVQASSVGNAAFISGWGRTETGIDSQVKLRLRLNISDPIQCRQKYLTKRVNLGNSQFCAGGVVNQDACTGDSGGPLMTLQLRNWVIEGIVSFGFECGQQGWPGVYTKVASYDNWIRSKLRA